MHRLLAILCLLAFPAYAQPNIVLILVDDFSQNLMPAATGPTNMPALRKMQQDGMTFTRMYVAEGRCCPSRAATFTGQMPHNNGTLTNTGPEGGLTAFTANGNEGKVFAGALQAGGYRTAFMGKYLNEWKPTISPIPPGWHKWVSTGNGYAGFDYALNDNGVISYPEDHFTDTIHQIGKTWITFNRQPFFLELAPFAPHGPYVPAVRHEGLFADYVQPETPAYNLRPVATSPAWLHDVPALGPAAKAKIAANYVLRVQSVASVDDMIAGIRLKLATIGIADDTYVIFTSDNGYHMGEFSMRAGKQTPFDFDINVPFVIVGPGIEPGSVSDEIAMNIDLAPTFLELAGLPANPAHDGRSMVPLFTGGTNGRTMAVVEHVQTPDNPADPDNTNAAAGDPPTYTALRTADALYVEYETGEVGYYTDEFQLDNIEATLDPAERSRLHDAVAAAQTCAGVTCHEMQER